MRGKKICLQYVVFRCYDRLIIKSYCTNTVRQLHWVTYCKKFTVLLKHKPQHYAKSASSLSCKMLLHVQQLVHGYRYSMVIAQTINREKKAVPAIHLHSECTLESITKWEIVVLGRLVIPLARYLRRRRCWWCVGVPDEVSLLSCRTINSKQRAFLQFLKTNEASVLGRVEHYLQIPVRHLVTRQQH